MSKRRRFSRWCVLLATGVIFVSWVASSLVVVPTFGLGEFECAAFAGRLACSFDCHAHPTRIYALYDRHKRTDGFSLSDWDYTGIVWPRASWGNVCWHIVIPLWIPFLACFSLSAYLWWYRKPRLPNHCPKCGYNLTGNTSGVCPECGTPVNRCPLGIESYVSATTLRPLALLGCTGGRRPRLTAARP